MNERPPRLPQYMSYEQRKRDKERLLLEIEMAQRAIQAAMERIAVIDRLNITDNTKLMV